MAHLEKRREEGCHNAKQLWREITEQGYKGGDKVVRQWAAPRRNKPGRLHSKREKARIAWQQAELAEIENQTGFATDSANEGSELEFNLAREGYMLAPAKPLQAAKHLVWLLLGPVEKLNQEELEVLKFMRQEEGLESAYNLAQSFLRMVKEGRGEELESWLGACAGSGVAELESFGASLQREFGAIAAALTLPYSNGPTEGAVNKLKMIKRTLYGRGSFEVLRRRVLLAA